MLFAIFLIAVCAHPFRANSTFDAKLSRSLTRAGLSRARNKPCENFRSLAEMQDAQTATLDALH